MPAESIATPRTPSGGGSAQECRVDQRAAGRVDARDEPIEVVESDRRVEQLEHARSRREVLRQGTTCDDSPAGAVQRKREVQLISLAAEVRSPQQALPVTGQLGDERIPP